jgi:hypothetical protein
MGVLRDSWRAPEREHPSLRELCLWGSFLGIRRDVERRAQGMDMSVQRELQEVFEVGFWKRGISPYGSSVRETWRGGFFAWRPEGYKRKALGTEISLYGGSVGQSGVGSSTGDLEIWL